MEKQQNFTAFQMYSNTHEQQYDLSNSHVLKYLYFRSILPPDALPHLTNAERKMYERVWDESDYVIPPAENSAFFVMTNVVITPNQTIGTCPEDHTEIKGVVCGSSEGDHVNITEGVCVESDVKILHKGHGEETGNCILSDRDESAYVCEISSWCPGMIQYYFFFRNQFNYKIFYILPHIASVQI